jgi:hypothetical protein
VESSAAARAAHQRKETGMFVLLILVGTYKLCSAVAFYLRVYAPTNIALDSLRSRRGLKWALPASLVLTPTYWGAGYAVATLIENGGPGWLNLVVGLLAWNGIKFAMLGVWSPLLLLRLWAERLQGRRERRPRECFA